MLSEKRYFNYLTHNEVDKLISEDSIICLPIGATEQHGLHLPLNTDTVLASGFAEKLVAEYSQIYDIWLLPPLEYTLSLEHSWASGTISFSIELFTNILHELLKNLINSQRARNFIIINGHGGNRGLLETIIQEFRSRYSVTAVVLHPSALARVKSGSKFYEVHGGKSETSIMLALAPELVNKELLPSPMMDDDQLLVNSRILDRAVSWPWHSKDYGIGREGIIGDAAFASVELGNEIINNAIKNSEEVIVSLIEFGKLMRKNSKEIHYKNSNESHL